MKIAKLDGGPEIFLSIQGEGPSAGLPCVFVRCSTCNLYCVWCDTDYTWNWEGTKFRHRREQENGYQKYRQAELIVEMAPAAVAEQVHRFSCRNVILTGGEPLLQQNAIVEMMATLRSFEEDYWFEAETNGTLLPTAEFDRLVDQYNVSPKLRNAGISATQREKPPAIRFFAECAKAYFKFVIAEAEEIAEVQQLEQAYELARQRIYLMPESTTTSELRARSLWLTELCKQHGYRFSDRLHVHLYGSQRGR